MVFWTAHQSGVANGFYFETGGLSAFPGNNNFITYPSWTNGQWTHAVCTRTGGRFRLFQNGVLVATTTTNPNINMDGHLLGMNGGDNFTSSAGYFGGGRYINGSIPTAYQTASTTTGTQIFTPPTSPFTTTSQGATSADVKVLVTFTNAAIIDDAMQNALETAGNAQLSTSIKKYGNASMYFDGTGDWLSFPANDRYAFGTGDYTVEAWVYFTSISSSTLQIIFASGSTGGNNFYCHVDGDQISVGTSAAFISNQPSYFTTNTWYHVAFCRSGGTLRLFKNGIQQGSSVTDSTNWISVGSSRVGANESGSQTVFGYIDDLRITKGVARYTANFTPPTSQLQDQ